MEVQTELAKDISKVKVKVTAFARITKDMQRGTISQENARKAKNYVRDLLYDALRDANISVEAFKQSISSERVYQNCGITRTANPRGRLMQRPVEPPREDGELRHNFPQYVRALAEVYGVLNEIVRNAVFPD